MELFKASNQWATRPDDERFATLEEALKVTGDRKKRAAEANVPFGALLATRHTDGGLGLVGPTGNRAALTNWSFKQLCAKVGAPAEYLATLPEERVEGLINLGIERADEKGKDVSLLLDVNGGTQVRAISSQIYGRIWDVDVVERLMRLRDDGWRVAPARPAFEGQRGVRLATPEDVLEIGASGLSVNVGDEIAPAGLYAGDRDSFFFMVNERFRVADGTPDGLSRGFFVENSEVANGKSFKITTFLYRHCCGNHIVWGAQDVAKFAVRHVGKADTRAFGELRGALVRYANDSASEDEAKIAGCKAFVLGVNREKAVDAAFEVAGISRKSIDAAFTQAEKDEEHPTTAWGLAQGVTRLSQVEPNADRRAELDRGAGRILKMAF